MIRIGTSLVVGVLLIIFTGCNDHYRTVQGGWSVIELRAAPYQMLNNGFVLKKDKTCILPLLSLKDRHTSREVGTWEYIRKRSISYIAIETDHPVFDRTFEVVNISRYQDTISYGYILRMTLVADSIKMVCERADHNPNP